jgi:hypothetical protein
MNQHLRIVITAALALGIGALSGCGGQTATANADPEQVRPGDPKPPEPVPPQPPSPRPGPTNTGDPGPGTAPPAK